MSRNFALPSTGQPRPRKFRFPARSRVVLTEARQHRGTTRCQRQSASLRLRQGSRPSSQGAAILLGWGQASPWSHVSLCVPCYHTPIHTARRGHSLPGVIWAGPGRTRCVRRRHPPEPLTDPSKRAGGVFPLSFKQTKKLSGEFFNHLFKMLTKKRDSAGTEAKS